MSSNTLALEQLLRDRGHSVTKARLAVFAAFVDHDPMTMAELYARVKDTLDRASVYRIVALYEELGILRRITVGWKYKLELSDHFGEHHHHLACLRCHTVIPLAEQDLEQFIAAAAAHYHFSPTEHQVEIQGYCESCGVAQALQNQQ